MVDALEQGATVYDLTGLSTIHQYEHITGGDYHAGIMAAAHDVIAMLLSYDSAAAARQVLKVIRIPPELRDALYDNDGLDKIEQMLKGGGDCMRDMILSRVHDGILGKTGKPGLIAHENGEPLPPKRKILSKIWRSLFDPSQYYAWQQLRIPASWPPLKSGFTIAAAPAGDTMYIEQAINKHPDFQKGFRNALETIYDEFQDIHFSKLHSKKYDLELSSVWNASATQITVNGFADLRFAIQQKIHGDATGLGETYQDGATAALEWTKSHIFHMRAHVSLQNNPEAGRILDAIKKSWTNEISAIGARWQRAPS